MPETSVALLFDHARKASPLPLPRVLPSPPTVMKFSSAALSATLVALAGGAAAQLSILTPGGPDLWWSKSANSLVQPSVERADAPLLPSCSIRQRYHLDMQDLSLHELHGFVRSTPLNRALPRRAHVLVRIINSDPKVLVSPLAFIAQQNNFDCSELVTKDRVNLTPATGYAIQLADPFNSTNVSFSVRTFPHPLPLPSLVIRPSPKNGYSTLLHT